MTCYWNTPTEKIRVIVLIFLLRYMYIDYAKIISYAQILFHLACYCKNQVSTWSIQTSIWVTINLIIFFVEIVYNASNIFDEMWFKQNLYATFHLININERARYYDAYLKIKHPEGKDIIFEKDNTADWEETLCCRVASLCIFCEKLTPVLTIHFHND